MRRLLRALGPLMVLATGLTAGYVAVLVGSADATACGSAVAAGSSCTLNGTVTLAGGSLTLTSPSSLSWGATLTGNYQALADTFSSQQQYTVDDATGSGDGWHVSLAATTFTSGSHAFANSGTFVTTGSTSSISSTSGPTATCTSSCTLPTNATTYPVAITTAASSPTPVVIYDTEAGTGVGSMVIGGSSASNPIGWWVNVPGSALAGSYVSTITVAIISGP